MPLILAPQLITPRGGDGSFFGDLVALGLTSNLQLCLDAGSADSYTSGQSWLDLAGSGYDFFRGADGGASSDDPTFNGTPGDLSSSEYWGFDGGDFFTYDSANESWMTSLHENNALFSFLAWFYFDNGNEQHIFGTRNGTNSGLNLFVEPDDTVKIQVRNEAANPLLVAADSSPNDSAWNLIGVVIDEAIGSGGGFHYLNGSYNQVSASNTFDATYSSPATGGEATMGIGTRGTGSLPFPAAARLAGVMFWSGVALAKTDFDNVWNRQKARFGL